MALCFFALLVSGAPFSVVARQAEPAGTPAATVVFRGCNARPASAAGLVAVLRQPAAEDPLASDPRGEAVPPSERAAIDGLVARWNACLASGDVRGLLGFFTADGVRRLLAERSPLVGGPAGLRLAILGINDVVRLPDGRMAARIAVDTSGNGATPPEMLTMVIERGTEGAWRIDHLSSAQGPVGAAGQPARDPQAATRPLLRNPVAPGPNVTIPAPGPSVPMRGGDAARSGNQPGPIPPAVPDRRWRTPLGWTSEAQPVVARGLVFFGGFSLGERLPLLEAVDATSGGVRWQTTAPVALGEFPDAPALAGDVVYAPVQAPVAGILAVAAENGHALWFAPFGFISLTAPAADTEAVYVAGWGPRNARDRDRSDTVGAVFALDQRTGRERWRFLASARFGAVAVGTGSVFVPSSHGLYALDRASGRKRWQARFTPGPKETPTVIADTVVFTGSEITSGNAGVFALDAASGALRWRVELPAAESGRGGTAASADTLFVSWWESATDEAARGAPTLRAYELGTGKERWVFRVEPETANEVADAAAMTAPVIAGDAVLFGVASSAPAGEASQLNGLYALDAVSGTLRWHGAAQTPINSAPAALNGVVYVIGGAGTGSDSLLALSAE